MIELARGEVPLSGTEDVRLDEVVAVTAGRVGRSHPDTRFELDLEPTVVEGLPDRLARAVGNLLDNAAKYGPPGGTVEVRLRDGELAVRDHGPGIPDEEAPFVFDRFFRGGGARGRHGSGLGLAIVRQVAESHGGGVSVEAADGGGARFRLASGARAPRGAPHRRRSGVPDSAAAGPSRAGRGPHRRGGALERAALPRHARPRRFDDLGGRLGLGGRARHGRRPAPAAGFAQ